MIAQRMFFAFLGRTVGTMPIIFSFPCYKDPDDKVIGVQGWRRFYFFPP